MSAANPAHHSVVFLRSYNAWRRSDDAATPMPEPRLIGEAIDWACVEIERLTAALLTTKHGPDTINTAKAEADFSRAPGQAVVSGLITQATVPTVSDLVANAAVSPTASIRTATGVKEVVGNVTRHTLK